MTIHTRDITGCILAGGQGRRLDGQDKGLLCFGSGTLAEYCVERFRPQVGEVVISANRNHARYRRFAPTVFADPFGDYAGPLAGLLGAMHAATTPYIATAACDSPFIPDDLVARLASPLESGAFDISVACGAGQLQPVFALMRTDLSDSLLQYLKSGERKILKWFERHRLAQVDFEDGAAFVNINTGEDLARAAEQLRLNDQSV